MLTLWRTPAPGNGQGVPLRCRITFGDRADPQPAEPGGHDAPAACTRLRQVHGTRVLRVEHPGQHDDAEADAAWTAAPGAVLVVRTADCVPLALYGRIAGGTPRPVVAVVHAGWRGLAGGVVEETAAALHAAGAVGLHAVVGPYIHASAYEFGEADLARLAASLGPQVAARTAWGAPALDLGAAAATVLARSRIRLDHDVARCTAADPARCCSHRARGDAERMATTVALR